MVKLLTNAVGAADIWISYSDRNEIRLGILLYELMVRLANLSEMVHNVSYSFEELRLSMFV